MVARGPSAWGCGPGRKVQSDSPAAAHSLRSSDPPHDPRHSAPDEGLITADNFVKLRVNRFSNVNATPASRFQIRSPVDDESEGRGPLLFNQSIDEEALAIGANIVITALQRSVGFKQRPHSANL